MWRTWLDRLRSSDRNAALPSLIELGSDACVSMQDHIRAQAPNVAVGLLSGVRGQVLAARPLRNLLRGERAKHEFLPDPDDRNCALQEIAARGERLIALYFSMRGAPTPPSTATVPGWEPRVIPVCVVVSAEWPLMMRAFTTTGSQVYEVPIVNRGIDAWLRTIEQQYASNACLALYTWLDVVAQCVRRGELQNTARLLAEIRSPRYRFWPAAQEAIDAWERALTLPGKGSTAVEDDGLALLIQMLDNSSRSVQREAVLALAYLQQFEALQRGLAHSDMFVRIAAAGLLRQSKTEAVPAFRAALNHPHWFVRRQAVEHLAAYGDESDLPAIIAALHDSDVDVRVAAIRALGKRGAQSAIGALQALLPTNVRDSNGYRLDNEIRDALLSIG
jgi:hypothetical protein